MRPAPILPLLVALFAPAPALAQPRPERTHAITGDDYFTINVIDSCALSPDGSLVAYTEARWDESLDKRNTDLWVVDVRTKEPLRLTFDPASDSHPEWSPDGRWIYFTSAPERAGEEKPPYDGETQVWRISPTGGEAQPVTRVEGGVEAFELARSGRTLYYTVPREHFDEDEWKSLRKENKGLEFGHGVVELSDLRRLDLTTWRDETVLESSRVIQEFAVSPDESRIAMLTTPDRNLITNEGWSRVDVWTRAAGETLTLPDALWREQAPTPFGWLLGLEWSDDSRALAFRIDFDGHPGELFVAEFDDRKHTGSTRIVRPNEVTLDGGLIDWIPGSRDLCFVAEDHARVRAYCVRAVRNGRQGAAETLTPGDVAVAVLSFGRAPDRMAVVTPGLDHPPDVFLVSWASGSPLFERLTRANPHVDEWMLPSIRIVSWKAPDGATVEGILELPAGYDPARDGPLPMAVEIHGGPTSATRYSMSFAIYGRTLFPARGWAVLSPNYRGSTGYGDKFLVDLIGRENDIEVQDILAGVDSMVERGIADPGRLAVMGWSNGGYLTNCLITTTDRFKAASSGAGMFDIVSQWSAQDTPGHNINYQRGLPWEAEEAYRSASPIFNAENITTPTVIHVGGADERVPPIHSRALYRAMRHYLHVPVELIVYPGEPHSLGKRSNRKAKMEWDQAWFDHHVLGKASQGDPPADR